MAKRKTTKARQTYRWDREERAFIRRYSGFKQQTNSDRGRVNPKRKGTHRAHFEKL